MSHTESSTTIKPHDTSKVVAPRGYRGLYTLCQATTPNISKTKALAWLLQPQTTSDRIDNSTTVKSDGLRPTHSV